MLYNACRGGSKGNFLCKKLRPERAHARSLTGFLSLSWCVFAARKIRDGDREKALFSMGAKRMPLSLQETAEPFLSPAACPASNRLRHFLFSFLLFF